MITALLYYVALPFIMAAVVLVFLAKYAPRNIPADIRKLFTEKPIEPRWFRAVKRDVNGLSILGDFKTHIEAVDCAYAAKEKAQSEGRREVFQILNDQGDNLEQVDS